jgi:hypothetical protein
VLEALLLLPKLGSAGGKEFRELVVRERVADGQALTGFAIRRVVHIEVSSG